MDKHSEFTLNVYGQRSLELLQALLYHIRDRHSVRGFVAEITPVMKPNNEVFAVANQWAVIPNNPQANIAYRIKSYISRFNKFNGRDDLDRELSFTGTRSAGLTRASALLERFKVKTTVGELRCLYEILLGRDEKRIISMYGEKTYRAVKGTPADCFAAAQKEIYIQEMKNLMEERERADESIRKEFNRRYDELVKWRNEALEQMKKECNDKEIALKMKFDESVIREVNSSNIYRLMPH